MSDDNRFSNDAAEQCRRLLKALIDAGPAGITSHYANIELGIYHPPARIKQLRNIGHHIVTEWESVETDIYQPRQVAKYVLISLVHGEHIA